MAENFHGQTGRAMRLAVFAALAAVPGAAGLLASRHPAEWQAQQTNGEIVANLAAGRVAVLVAKDGIAIATAQSQIEPETLPPLIVPLGNVRAAVILGPAEWVAPGSSRPPIRLDADLSRTGSLHANPGARAQVPQAENTATDIESIGLGFLDPLRHAAGFLHGPLHLQSQDWFVELLLVDYAPDYGPEVWSLRYRADQQLMRDDFYNTTIHRPEYVQLYPPDKGQPKTLVESTYPPHDPGEPPILDLLRADDSRLAPFRSADPGMGHAADLLLKGECRKIWIKDGLELLRASIQAVSPRGAKEMLVEITEDEGFKWVLGESELAPPSPEDQSKPGAPTLRKKPRPSP